MLFIRIDSCAQGKKYPESVTFKSILYKLSNDKNIRVKDFNNRYHEYNIDSASKKTLASNISGQQFPWKRSERELLYIERWLQILIFVYKISKKKII